MGSNYVGSVIVDGVEVSQSEANMPISDAGFQRGVGVFEAMRSYEGRLFRLEPHLDRLEYSAGRCRLDLPDRDDLVRWCTDKATEADVVRVLVTGGDDPLAPGGSRTIVFGEMMPPLSETVRITPMVAPWHSDGVEYELTAAKTLSYAPNFTARLYAQHDGFDDALLIGRSGNVLEGPTYSIGWVTDGVIETPSLELGILRSITRDAMIDVAGHLGLGLKEVVEPLERLLTADEVFVLSTGREVCPVVAVGETSFVPGPVSARLQEGFTALVAEELGL